MTIDYVGLEHPVQFMLIRCFKYKSCGHEVFSYELWVPLNEWKINSESYRTSAIDGQPMQIYSEYNSDATVWKSEYWFVFPIRNCCFSFKKYFLKKKLYWFRNRSIRLETSKPKLQKTEVKV